MQHHLRPRRRAQFSLSDWDYMPLRIGVVNRKKSARCRSRELHRETMKVLRDYQIRSVLRAFVDRYPSDSAAAKAFGVTRGHLSRVLRGQKPVDGAIAHALGYERQDCYVPYESRR